MSVAIDVDDPRREDVRRLLELHWAFASELSPPEHCHTLDIDELLSPGVSFFSARDDVAAGFTPCEPFGEYTSTSHSGYMTRAPD
ncbi:MAG: hypothetical protein JO148_16955, partial [Acidimicrobiia bacterium]|nr:hypothetical protein [Acidimicrobiia bacterium]